MARLAAAAVITALLVAGWVTASPALAQDRTRVDLYDANSRREGYAIIDRDTGRVDLFDRDSRRLGYGKISGDGRLERFDTSGRRDGAASMRPQRIRP